MHFHVTETGLSDRRPFSLGGFAAMDYPGNRPVFDTAGDGAAAIMDSAFYSWGSPAELHVEIALAVEFSTGRETHAEGAIVGWIERHGVGALWLLRSCNCADGILAQIFAAEHR